MWILVQNKKTTTTKQEDELQFWKEEAVEESYKLKRAHKPLQDYYFLLYTRFRFGFDRQNENPDEKDGNIK